MKKKIAIFILILLLLAAAGAAVYYFFFRNPVSGNTDKIFVQSVETLQSYGGYGNRYSGIVETQKSNKTEFDPEKKLDQLFVAVDDLVKVGDPLFSYDTESISLEIDQLNLEIERLNTENVNTTAQIGQLQKDWDKLSDTDRLDYSAQIAQMQADIAQNEYDIRSKQAEIKKKKSSIENSTVLCEMEGRVTEINDIADIIAGTNLDENGSPSNDYITIVAEGNFRIKGKVSETNIADIYPGLEITVRSRTDESKTWAGTVSSIDTQNTAQENNTYVYESSSADQASRYAFYVELDNTDGLMIGQHLILEPAVEQDITSEGIWLSSGWIVTEENGNTYLWAAPLDGAKLEKRSIQTGRYVEETDQTEIVSGLSLSDYIAWPDDSCYEGAPTTSEYVVKDDESLMEEGEGGPVMIEDNAITVTDPEMSGTQTIIVDEADGTEG